MTVKTYSPKKVQLIVLGNIISGFAAGTFIVASREVDAFTKILGGDGEVARTQSANRSGEVTITLLQTSGSNDILSAIAVADELAGTGIGPIIIKDTGGSTVLFSGEGWIRKQPDVEFADEAGDREWIIDMASMDYFVGGNQL